LMDDSRYFVGNRNYSTLDELRALVSRLCPGYVFEVGDDIIRVYGPEDE